MRLTYTPDPPVFSNPSEQAFLEKLLKDRGHLGLGPLYRTLLISPTFARGFLQFFTAIRYRSTLPADVMELAMCRVGALNGAAFEWMHHAPLLRKAGLSDEGVETVRTAEPGRKGDDGEGGLSARMWSVMRYVDAMTKEVRVSDEVFEAVRKEMEDEKQVVELSMYSLFHLLASFILLTTVVPLGDTGAVSKSVSNLLGRRCAYNTCSTIRTEERKRCVCGVENLV